MIRQEAQSSSEVGVDLSLHRMRHCHIELSGNKEQVICSNDLQHVRISSQNVVVARLVSHRQLGKQGLISADFLSLYYSSNQSISQITDGFEIYSVFFENRSYLGSQISVSDVFHLLVVISLGEVVDCLLISSTPLSQKGIDFLIECYNG